MRPNRPVLKISALALTAALALMAAGTAQAAVAWNEAVNGDLSGNGLAPSFAAFVAGGNQLLGSTGRIGGVVDRDYLHFTVPAGYALQSLMVLPGTTGVPGAGAFIGLQAGNQVTLSPDTFSAAGLLGWTLFGPDQIGTDLFDTMSNSAADSSGFAVPLPAGSYSLWVQETGVGVANYALEFMVVEVPEAPTVLTMIGGLALLAAAMRRR